MNLSSLFLLRNDITYLNFGSFGACPKPVFQRYQQYQLELEQEPVQFITSTGLQYLRQSKEALGAYINCAADDLIFLPNPSHAVNLIAKSFPLQAGDEVLATEIEYGACDRAWQFYCEKAGAVYKRQPIRFPLESKEDFVSQFFQGLTTKTKLVFISHITSSTGLRLPVEEICSLAKEKGLMVFVDGAHAPGHIPLDLQTLNADIYTGACHKWMMTPKGSSFLYVKREFQNLFEPLVVSWGYNALFPSASPFQDYHQQQGTRDFSAFLTIPGAISFMQEHNWEAVSTHFRGMTQDNAATICQLLNAKPIAPVNDDFILQMYSAEVKTKEPEKLHDHFFNEYRIQVPVMRQNNKVYLRYSLNAFNSQQDLDKLFDAIKKITSSTNLIEA
ncbi:MAG TPA: aminotransferase class V-fold PLP-dependent enzyme [Flavisolibacter sp.]|jgi:isopenicillin-N epimerase